MTDGDHTRSTDSATAMETDRIAALEATVLAQTERINEMEARLAEQSGAIGALAAASMVSLLATRIKDVGRRLGFAEQKKTIESLLSTWRWRANEGEAEKALAAAKQTSGAAFDWIETMMEPLIEARNTELAERREQDERDRQFEDDLERGSTPAGFFRTLKAAEKTVRAQTGTFDDVKQGNNLTTLRVNRFGRRS